MGDGHRKKPLGLKYPIPNIRFPVLKVDTPDAFRYKIFSHK
jgi:hypothetical protein